MTYRGFADQITSLEQLDNRQVRALMKTLVGNTKTLHNHQDDHDDTAGRATAGPLAQEARVSYPLAPI